jgi:uncharacterized membrane protein YgcG
MSTVDSTGVLLAQQNYLNSIKNQATTPETAASTASAKAMLNNIYNNYGQADQYSSQVLTNQKQVSDIVSTELTRLQQKKQSIDTALVTRERVAELNDSYRLRYIEYTKMIAIVVLALVIFIAARMAGKYFPAIPSIVIDIVYIFLFCGTCILLYNQMAYIQNRDVLYFDRLNLNGPNMKSAAQIANDKKAAGLSGNLLDSINIGACIGETCCSTGTYWDASNSVCAPGTGSSSSQGSGSSSSQGSGSSSSQGSDGFSTLNASFYVGNTFSPSANSPFEFTDYTKI